MARISVFPRLVVGQIVFLIVAFMSISLPLMYFTNAPRWFDVSTGASIAPKLYIMVMVACIPLAFYNWSKLQPFLKHPFIILSLVLIAVHLIATIRVQNTDLIYQQTQMITIFERMLLIPCFAYVAYNIHSRWTIRCLQVLCIVVPASIIIAFINPGWFVNLETGGTTSSGRVGAMWINPNIAGEALLLSLALAAGRFSRTFFTVVFVLAGFATLFTGSRAAIIGWLVLGAILMFKGQLPKYLILIPVLATLNYFTLYDALENYLASTPEHERGAAGLLARMDFVSGQADAEDGGGDSRFGLAEGAFKASMQKPILGYGYGYEDLLTESGQGPHNQLLQMWHTYGIAGPLLWLGIVWLLFRHTASREMINPHVFCFVWFSLFSHNILEHNHWYVYFGLVFFLTHRSFRLQTLSNDSLIRIPRLCRF